MRVDKKMKQDERDKIMLDIRDSNIIQSAQILSMSEKVDDIRKTLFGNGREGLVYTMVKHKVYFGLMGGILTILTIALINNIFG